MEKSDVSAVALALALALPLARGKLRSAMLVSGGARQAVGSLWKESAAGSLEESRAAAADARKAPVSPPHLRPLLSGEARLGSLNSSVVAQLPYLNFWVPGRRRHKRCVSANADFVRPPSLPPSCRL